MQSDSAPSGVLPTVRPQGMPPLITHEEALQLGEIEDHAAIEALVDRAWEARVERFGAERQLRRVRKSAVSPRPDGAPNVGLEVIQVEGEAAA